MPQFVCPFPWTATCLTTDGAFRVCSVAQSSQTRGIIKDHLGVPKNIRSGESPSEILNSASLKDLRRRMMNDEDVSDTCARCLFEEKNNLVSHRIAERERMPSFDENFIATWTEADGALRAGSPIVSGTLRLGNKCNLTCRMCGPSSSASWYREWIETKHKGYQETNGRVVLEKNQSGVVIPSPNPYLWTDDGSALKFVDECGPYLERIEFSGGEPLLSSGHLEILNKLVETGRASKIILNYTCNLTVLPEAVLKLWKSFKRIDLGISLDGPPEINEYVRFPLKSQTYLANLKKLDSADIPGNFWFTTTVQIYNVLYLDQMHAWIEAQNFSKIPTKLAWHLLQSPHELSIFALPLEVKNKIAEKLRLSPTFSSLANVIFEKDKSDCFPEFIKRTRIMDQYRNQNIENFPELWRLLSAHSINS